MGTRIRKVTFQGFFPIFDSLKSFYCIVQHTLTSLGHPVPISSSSHQKIFDKERVRKPEKRDRTGIENRC